MIRTREGRPRPARENALRMAPFALRAADEVVGDGNTLDGWAAVFNRVTVIDSWEGRFKERARPGSMRRSFREAPPKIQFDHGKHPLIGSIPIARTEVAEEAVDPELAPEGGAHILGRLHDNWLIEPVRDAIRSGAVNGMSFRFTVVRETWTDPDGKKIKDARQLEELLMRTWFEDVPEDELLLRDLDELRVPELGPVVFPAYDDTSVGVRSVTIDLGRLDDPDQRATLARAVLLADTAAQPDFTGRSDARSTDGGDDGEESREDETPTVSTSARTRDRVLRMTGVIR